MIDELSVNFYRLSTLSADDRQKLLHQRAQDNLHDVEGVVSEIIAGVRERGDAALVEFAARYDGAQLHKGALQVSDDEFATAERSIEPRLREAMTQAVSNIRSHHISQLPAPSWMKEISPGVISGERVTPIASVGLYVPRGKGAFPSVMMMLCTPAVIAGVPEVVVCTPPAPDGTVDAASLVAARLCGVEKVFKVGGAQAIAALAYGTAAIPKVDKILGPGNQFVSAARRMLTVCCRPGATSWPKRICNSLRCISGCRGGVARASRRGGAR